MRVVGWGLCTVLFALIMVGSLGAAVPAPGVGIFVADTGNNRIVRFDDMTGAGWTTLGGPTGGGGTNQFNNPRAVSVDSAGRIYVADTGNNRIVRFDDMTGAGWTTLGGPATGRGTNQFTELRSIFVDTAKRIYVAEDWRTITGHGIENGRIVAMNDMAGAGWIDCCKRSAELSAFAPKSIFVDTTGRIFVAALINVYNPQIVQMNDMTGAGLTALGSEGSGVKQFRGPSGIVVDAAGRIYVADFGNGRVVRINDMTGAGWTALGTQGNRSKQFTLPNGIFVDAMGRIYVVDFGNNRIVRFDDMTGAGWTTLGSSGDGTGQFNSPRGIFAR